MSELEIYDDLLHSSNDNCKYKLMEELIEKYSYVDFGNLPDQIILNIFNGSQITKLLELINNNSLSKNVEFDILTNLARYYLYEVKNYELFNIYIKKPLDAKHLIAISCYAAYKLLLNCWDDFKNLLNSLDPIVYEKNNSLLINYGIYLCNKMNYENGLIFIEKVYNNLLLSNKINYNIFIKLIFINFNLQKFKECIDYGDKCIKITNSPLVEFMIRYLVIISSINLNYSLDESQIDKCIDIINMHPNLLIDQIYFNKLSSCTQRELSSIEPKFKPIIGFCFFNVCILELKKQELNIENLNINLNLLNYKSILEKLKYLEEKVDKNII
jgi:hypothetical protein